MAVNSNESFPAVRFLKIAVLVQHPLILIIRTYIIVKT